VRCRRRDPLMRFDAMSQASPDNIDLNAVLAAIKARVPRLVVLSAAAGVVTFLGLGLVAPRYQSEAELVVSAKGLVDPFQSPRKDGGGAESFSVRMDKEAVNTHVRALRSPELGAEIAAKLKLAERPEFNSELGPVDALGRILLIAGIGAPRPGESEQDRVLNRFYERLEVYSPKESRAIAIRFTATDADLAADVPNALAEAYRRSLAEQSIVETDEVQQALGPKIDKLKLEVGETDAAVEKFRGEADIFKGGQQSTGLNEQQLAELTAELSRAQAMKSEVESRFSAAREMMKSGSGDAIPEVQRSPLMQAVVQQRVRLERQISELSVSLLPGHPRMQQLNADLAGLKKQIAGEVAKVVDSLDKEAKAAALRVEAVQKDVGSVKARVVDTGPDEVKLRQLQTEAQSKRAELERLQAQFEANRAKADSRAVPIEARIVSRARAASVPEFPRKGPFAALAAFATLLLGLAITITRALLAGARTTAAPGARQSATGRPVGRTEPVLAPVHAAVRPELEFNDDARVDTSEPMTEQPAAVAARGRAEPSLGREPMPIADVDVTRIATMGSLARRLSSRSDSGGYRTLIAGETDMMGVGNHAVELAKAVAEVGQSVILIDWAPEGDGIAHALTMPQGPGIFELLSGGANFEHVVRRVPGSEAQIIGSGAFDGDVSALLDPDRLNLVLDALDEAYDQVIVAGRYVSARAFFEAIEGRIDCGVLVADPGRIGSELRDPPGSYLGFEVAEIDLVRYDRQVAAGEQRIMRAGRNTVAVAG
jgi:succinoglycan biosynthesis transport protein ExoP